MALTIESFLLYFVGLITAITAGLYFYLTRNFSFWKKVGIPFVKPTPFYGNLKEVFLQKLDIPSHLKNIYDVHKEKPYIGLFALDKPVLLVHDLDLIKDILVKDSNNFIDHILTTDDRVDPIFANILFSIKGQQWKHLRAKLSPTFTSGKMKLMFNLVDNCAKELVQVLEESSSGGSPVMVKDMLARFTTDSISTCALGIESNALKNPGSAVRKHMRKVFEFTLRKGIVSTLMFFTPEIYQYFKLKFLDDDTGNFFRSTIWETVKYRQQNGVVRKDMLDSLIELRKKEQANCGEIEGIKVDGDVFVAQAFGIFTGGFETSSSATTFALYELSRHQEMQSRLREEMVQVLQKHNQEVTYDALQEMPYLDMVVSETLRKYPVLGFLDRVCANNYKLPDPTGKRTITLPGGTSVYIPLYAIHCNPEYYPEPDRFDPERFAEENKKTRHNFAYFPFGEGPRVCIGKRFGIMQVKIALAHVLTRFEVAPCKDTPRSFKFDPKSFVMQSEQDIPLSFNKLHRT